ncbi:MFS transporter [Streptomyces acidiscabies]|uniref:MFS transporter n=1 Tax=Streptomyces acidiscabies TaxID=42234 RepID=A0AAP6BEH9_9ACTN|nr:MFS transporter [Streptomyces acidiscabies]MBP5941907.1 MFS transporter [Streptomyces sp. LBUM 1476]MBZ3913355.1 MFS transporter [Streptomyces acidiscabies]MDX2963219.1 MFS transporter [Streptomyces acidiscabies]MDX3024330.1 MFS transporter [Streptomyces acidiscabies]MDX3795272.1 MFS transporter [Streptomyces acidiscabies]
MADTNGARTAPIGRSMAILGLAALAFSLAQTSLAPALSDMAASLHTSPQNTAWALTGYLVAAAVLTPVFGRLGDMFGKRRLLVASLVLFAIGGAWAALGDSLTVVVIGRVVMGAGGGIFPLCFGIIRDEFPAHRRAGAVGLVSAIAGLGGGLGLLMGGLLVDHASYRWIFWAGTMMAAVAAVAAHFLLPESPVRTPGKVDFAGTALLGAGITAPLIAISQASTWGWTSGRTLGLIAAGLVVLAVFVLVERRTAEPLVDMGVLVQRPVLMTNVATLLIGFGMFGVFLLVPQLVQTPEASGYGFGGDATRAGLLMLPGCLMMLVAGPLSGVLTARFGGKVPLSLGGVVTAAGLALLAVAHGSQGAVLGFTMVVFTGIGLAFAAMPNLIVDAVDPARTGEATGVNALVRSVGSSLGSQVIASILANSATASNPLPTEHAYTVSFLVGGAGALVAAVVTLLIPRARPRRQAESSGPLPEPALAVEDGKNRHT